LRPLPHLCSFEPPSLSPSSLLSQPLSSPGQDSWGSLERSYKCPRFKIQDHMQYIWPSLVSLGTLASMWVNLLTMMGICRYTWAPCIFTNRHPLSSSFVLGNLALKTRVWKVCSKHTSSTYYGNHRTDQILTENLCWFLPQPLSVQKGCDITVQTPGNGTHGTFSAVYHHPQEKLAHKHEHGKGTE
jgi:hypothetical protein